MIPRASLAGSLAVAGMIGFSLLLTFLLFRPALTYLVGMWGGEDFSYGYFILPIVFYLVWEKREALLTTPSAPSWAGLVPFAAGIGLYWLGELGGEFTALFLALWLIVVGFCWLHLGGRKLKIVSFPLAFLLVMFPPPNLLYANLSLRLKLVSSWLGVEMIQLFGLSAHREGNIIDLGFTQLEVVDACSGLRYLFPLVALSILLAYHYRAAFWKRGVLVVSSIPITIFTNALRIAFVGILYQFFGSKVAEGFFHDFSGWLIFMASLAFLLLEMWALSRLFPDGEKAAASVLLDTRDQPTLSTSIGRPAGARSGPTRFVVAILLLLATLLVLRTVDFRERIPLARPLGQVPMTIGEWSGVRSAMERDFLDTLKLSDYLLADYRTPQGKAVNVYVAYNESQRKGESSHSPDSCLPGNGWVFEDSGTVALPVRDAEGNPTVIRRAFIRKDGDRQLTYYWFPQRGRVLTNMFQLKAYTFWDALTRQRTDGALVRLITPVYGTEQPRDAEARLQRFALEFVPVLAGFLPGKGHR